MHLKEFSMKEIEPYKNNNVLARITDVTAPHIMRFCVSASVILVFFHSPIAALGAAAAIEVAHSLGNKFEKRNRRNYTTIKGEVITEAEPQHSFLEETRDRAIVIMRSNYKQLSAFDSNHPLYHRLQDAINVSDKLASEIRDHPKDKGVILVKLEHATNQLVLTIKDYRCARRISEPLEYSRHTKNDQHLEEALNGYIKSIIVIIEDLADNASDDLAISAKKLAA